MSGAVAGWYNNPPQGNVSLAAKILCHRGSPILAELLIDSCGSSPGGVTGDLDQVTIGREGKSGKLVQIGFSSIVQNVFAGSVEDDRFGNCQVVIQVGYPLVQHLRRHNTHKRECTGCLCRRACLVGCGLRLIGR
jgi:hypothetical protein